MGEFPNTPAAPGCSTADVVRHNNGCISYPHTRTDIMRHLAGEETYLVLKAAVVGATGIVGQQFVLALQQHPWFRIEALARPAAFGRAEIREERARPRAHCAGMPDCLPTSLPSTCLWRMPRPLMLPFRHHFHRHRV